VTTYLLLIWDSDKKLPPSVRLVKFFRYITDAYTKTPVGIRFYYE